MKSLARSTLIAFACAMLASAAGAQSQGPNAPGTIANDATVGTLPWTLLANAAASDNMYTQVAPGGMPSQYLKVTNFGFVIPPAAVIDGITVSVERRSAAGLISDFSARIVKGGVIGATEKAIAGTWATTDTVVNYGGNSDLWGESWTAADINSSAFGFVLSATDNVDVAAVDFISITVTYSLCGDSQIGLSEECDDGNTANGDCCSSTCQFDAPGTACLDDGNPCNGSETCVAGRCQAGSEFATFFDFFWREDEPWVVLQLPSGRRTAVPASWTDLPTESFSRAEKASELLPAALFELVRYCQTHRGPKNGARITPKRIRKQK
jgi:cysteine-rich repeat protein